MMRRGEQGTTAVNDLLNRLDSGMKTARTLIEQPADIALIDEQLAAVEQYKRAFKDMAQAGDNRETPAASWAPPPTMPCSRSAKSRSRCCKATA
jgi:hypothetical protein